MKVVDPVKYFRGEWTFDRSIRDARAGQRGTATGTATFVPRGEELSWRETGLLEIGQAHTRATRELIIARDESSGSGWVVLFDDRRPFHPLDLDDGACGVEHPCRNDLYRGRLEALGPGEFRTRWRVAGPEKDLEIETLYSRISASN